MDLDKERSQGMKLTRVEEEDDDDDKEAVQGPEERSSSPAAFQKGRKTQQDNIEEVEEPPEEESETKERWNVQAEVEEEEDITTDEDSPSHNEHHKGKNQEQATAEDEFQWRESSTPSTQEQQIGSEKATSEDLIGFERSSLSRTNGKSNSAGDTKDRYQSEETRTAPPYTGNNVSGRISHSDTTVVHSNAAFTSSSARSNQAPQHSPSGEPQLTTTPVQYKSKGETQNRNREVYSSILFGDSGPSRDPPYQQIALWKRLGLKVPSPQMGELVCRDERMKQRRFPLCDGQNTIGRSDSCAILLNDIAPVSLRHASIDINWAEGIYTIRDLSSTNGTTIYRPTQDSAGTDEPGEAVFLLPRRLYCVHDGTEIVLGDFKCSVNLFTESTRRSNFDSALQEFRELKASKLAEQSTSNSISLEKETQVEGASMTVPYPSTLQGLGEDSHALEKDEQIGKSSSKMPKQKKQQQRNGDNSTEESAVEHQDKQTTKNDRNGSSEKITPASRTPRGKRKEAKKENESARQGRRPTSTSRSTVSKRAKKTEDASDGQEEEEFASTTAKTVKRRRVAVDEKSELSAAKSSRAKAKSTADSNSSVKILFTCIVPTKVEKRDITKMGGEIVDDPHTATHLITSELQRTVKLLVAMSKIPHIVTHQWLKDSRKAGQFIELAPDCAVTVDRTKPDADPLLRENTEKYRLADPKNEKLFGVDLREVLPRRNLASPIFEGYTIYASKSVKPPPELLRDIVQAAGAKWARSLPKKPTADHVIICSKEFSKDSKFKRLVSAASSNWDVARMSHWFAYQGCSIYSEELVLSGILKQDLPWDSTLYSP
eukprot:gb/GECG01009739.1/.p1 GENE.gb/GECG01009739.1/~~gb/GECG01009739.1/.p1  ORF type:complete len:828 (+),score=132.17 gb/GECG01009739.1/:1-2484(+)